MTCWCTGPVTKQLSVVQLAVLLSLGLHGVAAWWLLQRNTPVQRITVQPATGERRLQVTLLPVAKQPDPPAPIAANAPATAATPLPQREGRAEPSTARVTVTGGETLERELAAVSNAAPSLVPPAAGGNQALQPRLELNLGAAAKAAERQRSQSPLASAVDAQQMQTGAAKSARAFSKLEAMSSIAEETVTADGGRLIRFSGGGCMRMPKPSSRNHDDVRKPMMENC